MITKKNISDALLKQLGFNTQDRKIDPREIWWAVDRARHQIIGQLIEANKNNDAYEVPSEFLIVKEATVQDDDGRGLRYIKLPAGLASLGDNMGLRQVGDTKNERKAFKIVEAGSLATYDGLEAGNLEDQAWLEGDSLYFEDLDFYYDKLLVKQVGSIADLGPNDPIPVPATHELQLMEVTKQIFQEEKLTPEDIIGDNISNPN